MNDIYTHEIKHLVTKERIRNKYSSSYAEWLCEWRVTWYDIGKWVFYFGTGK
jgi:hypothetical protein